MWIGVWIGKSVSRIIIWHHEACQVMTNGDPEGQIFFYPSPKGFFFLLKKAPRSSRILWVATWYNDLILTQQRDDFVAWVPIQPMYSPYVTGLSSVQEIYLSICCCSTQNFSPIQCHHLMFFDDALHPSQHFFSHLGTFSCLPELSQY